MSRHMMINRYRQLRRELEEAYAKLPWNTKTLDRLTSELSTLERALAMGQTAPSASH